MLDDTLRPNSPLTPEVDQATQTIKEAIRRWMLDSKEYTTREGENVVALCRSGIKGYLFRIRTKLDHGRIPIYVEREIIASNYEIELHHLVAIFDLDTKNSWIYFAPANISSFLDKLDVMFELHIRAEKARFQPLGNQLPISSEPRVAIGEYIDGTHDTKIRNDCIKFHGSKCYICGFDFGEKYKDIGKGFIEVHHLELKIEREGKYISPIDDLRPVCANCHAMLHQRIPPYSINEFQEITQIGK